MGRYEQIPASERLNWIINSHLFFVWIGLMGIVLNARPISDQIAMVSSITAGFYLIKERCLQKKSRNDKQRLTWKQRTENFICTDQ